MQLWALKSKNKVFAVKIKKIILQLGNQIANWVSAVNKSERLNSNAVDKKQG